MLAELLQQAQFEVQCGAAAVTVRVGTLIVTICGDSVDITEIPSNLHIEWESLLNELKAEHIPGMHQDGKRMAVSVVQGNVHALIYRTAKTPPETQILEILKRHGIEASHS